MVTDVQIGVALEAFDQKAGYSKIEKMRAALEAALSAAEPVMYVSEQQLAQCVGHYVPSRKTAEGNFQLALYRAPPAPSVAVKALDARAEAEALANRAGIDIGDDHDMFVDDLAKTLTRFAALSAQVQDVAGWQPIETAPKDGSEILLYREDCGVILGRWIACCDFVADGDPSAEFCQSDEEWEEPDWFGADFVSGFRVSNDGAPTHWMPLPAAPSKQEG